MKKSFMDADVLLTGPVAVQLYHGAAEDTPLFDYSSHLNAEAIALNI
jgi:glucuronate isomerase